MFRWKLFCVILFIQINNVRPEDIDTFLKPYPKEIDYSICILKLLRKNYSCGHVITVVYNDSDINDALKLVNSENCFSVITRTYLYKYSIINTNRIYLLFARSIQNLYANIESLSRDELFNPRAYFIMHLSETNKWEITNIFKTFLNLNVFSLIFITETNKELALYTYDPLIGTNCGKHFDILRKLDTCDTDENSPQNIPKSLRGCTVNIAAQEDIPGVILNKSIQVLGIEQFIMKTVAEYEGLTINYTYQFYTNYGVVQPNYTVTGILAHLQREADIVLGGLLLVQNRAKLFDFAYEQYMESVNIYTPALTEQKWKKVYKEFNSNTWYLLVFSFVLVSVIITSINYFKYKRDNGGHLILSLWGYLCNNSDQHLPEQRELKQLICFWIWFSFLITNFYNTALISLVTCRLTETHNYHDFRDVPYNPCVNDAMRLFVLLSSGSLVPNITNAPEECKLSARNIDIVASRTDLYTVEVEYVYKRRESKLLDERGQRKLQVHLYSKNSWYVIYMDRGFLLRDKIQKYINMLYEGGFMLYQKARIFKNNKWNPPNEFNSVKMFDYWIHFALLAFGLSVSAICFLIELLWSRFSRIYYYTE